MKKIFILPSLSLMMMAFVLLFACQKQEALMSFPEKLKPPPPVTPPPVDPPPLSEDRKNIQFLYNDAAFHTSIIARKFFGEMPQPSGSYANGFDLVIRLDDNAEEIDFQQLQIRLPLDADGKLQNGNYIIEDNQVKEGGNIDILYTQGRFSQLFPDAVFSADRSKFNFNLSLRIQDFNSTDHSIAGVIDSFRINLIEDTSKHITIRNAGFNFFYDYLEIALNDQLMYEGTTNPYSFWYPRVDGGGINYLGITSEQVYPVSEAVPFNKAQLNFWLSYAEPEDVFTRTTALPTMYAPENFLLKPEGYFEIDGRGLSGIAPEGDYTCRFINAPAMDVSGGMEVNFDNGKRLMEEFYDYTEDPIWGVYYPQEFKYDIVYKVKCRFYQKRL